MKRLKAISAVLLLGTATLAAAQTASESFGDQFKTMQSLQSVGTYTFRPAPTLGSKPTDPLVKESFAETFDQMQAESSNSGEWDQPTREAAPGYANRSSDPVGRESFADMFARMQAASSNSGEWNQPATGLALASATTSDDTVAGNAAATPTLAQRIARAFHPFSGSSSQSN